METVKVPLGLKHSMANLNKQSVSYFTSRYHKKRKLLYNFFVVLFESHACHQLHSN